MNTNQGSTPIVEYQTKNNQMKRSGPIKRKTPLRRGFSQLKRTKLKPRSKDKEYWENLYREAKALYPVFVRPADIPFALLHQDECDFHHPFGRAKERILCFLPITKKKHHNIHHKEPNKAMEQGWLQPEYRSKGFRPQGTPHPRPWEKSYEEKWPKKYQRQEHKPNNHEDIR